MSMISMNYWLIGLFFYPVLIALPLLILYFVIKLAVKQALKEAKQENILQTISQATERPALVRSHS